MKMNWYELARPDEVKEVLENLLSTYGFVKVTWERSYIEGEGTNECRTIPSNGFEIAEALWGEYGEEVL